MKKFSKFFVNILKDNIKVVNVLSFIFTLLTVFGTSYFVYGNGNLVFKNIFYFICALLVSGFIFILFKFLLNLLFKFLDNGYLYKENKKISKFRKVYDGHPFVFGFIFIILAWLPYIISFYPSILAPDPAYQIMQFFGYENKFANSFYSVDFDPAVTTITNHHPVFHTLVLGGCVKLGRLLGSDNFGLFIYSFIQILVLSSVLALTLKYMKKISISYKLRKIFLFIYAFVPMFPLYAMNPVKDVMFTCFVILYILFLARLVKEKEEKLNIKNMILVTLILIFLMLFRHNVFHLIILSLPFLILINKVNRKKLIVVLITVLAFNYSYNNIVLPYFKIVPSSVKEKLSIPFQQTARYVKYYSNELTIDEYNAIDNVLGMEDLKERYNPENADPVKDKFNREASVNKEYLDKYFKVWFKCFFKHPTVYIDATINNIYGYFYPIKTNWYVYYKSKYANQDDINDYGFDYHFNSLTTSRNLLSTFGKNFQYIPVVGWICNIGVNTWTLFILTAYLFYKKKKEGIVVLLPSLITLLVCVAAPVNCYYRYVLPFVFSMPLVISFVLDYTKKE